ncbi:hypothetical protein GOV12_03860 [Candidatus Pacearchaeota archaeon]|nr:hypothetical protein [Candidatus Pacearchaeota archaeon]
MAFEACEQIISGKITEANAQELLSQCPFLEGFTGGAFGALLVLGIVFLVLIFLLIFLALYIYTSFARMTIARKLKHKYPWLAWIPFAKQAQFLQLGGFHWAWIFLVFLPVIGWITLWVLSIISNWRIFKRRNYSGWLALVPILIIIPKIGGLAIIADLVILGFVAWKDIKK